MINLTFVTLYGSYYYGGVSSPFLPWLLTALLLGFFYLGERPVLVLGVFSVNIAGFYAAYAIRGSFPEYIPLSELTGVGIVSVVSATIYVSMMAIYYADVVTSQSLLVREAERHRATAARMRRAMEDAERANGAKSIFLAKMSHQLRTPLNAVIGYSEILLEDAELKRDSAQIEDLRRINAAGKHLLSLVTSVLDLSKIEADKTELVVEPFDVASFIDDVVATSRSLVVANHNEFVIERSPDLGIMISDATKLRQSVLNLLSNAGKFTKDGRVTLNVARERGTTGDWIRICIEDNGIGITADNVQKLFKDFNQAEASTVDQVWRHRVRIGAQPKSLPHDGRSDHGRKHLWPGITVHHPCPRLYRGRGSVPAKARCSSASERRVLRMQDSAPVDAHARSDRRRRSRLARRRSRSILKAHGFETAVASPDDMFETLENLRRVDRALRHRRRGGGGRQPAGSAPLCPPRFDLRRHGQASRHAPGRRVHRQIQGRRAFSSRRSRIASGSARCGVSPTAVSSCLRHAEHATKEASRVKVEFLAKISHELRTPLNAIIGFSELMMRDKRGLANEQYRSYISDIHSSGRHLLDIINDILDFAKAEAGQLVLFESNVDVQQVAQGDRASAGPAGPRLRHRPSDPHTGRSADDLVRRAQAEADAAQPREQRGEVHAIRRRGRDIGASGTRTDTSLPCGTAVSASPNDDLDRVLEPFVQAETTLSRRQEGTGLGLALVKSMIEIHGGRLRLESTLGNGTSGGARVPRGTNFGGAGGRARRRAPAARTSVRGECRAPNLETIAEPIEPP